MVNRFPFCACLSFAIHRSRIVIFECQEKTALEGADFRTSGQEIPHLRARDSAPQGKRFRTSGQEIPHLRANRFQKTYCKLRTWSIISLAPCIPMYFNNNNTRARATPAAVAYEKDCS
jgi:hypothetical protein